MLLLLILNSNEIQPINYNNAEKIKIIMIIRIVKLNFHEENIDAFLENFNSIENKIRNSDGNRFLQLLQDKNDRCTFFTYSHWETEQDLENYRNSAFFDEVWRFTKKLFNKKAEAWSCKMVDG